MLSILSGILGFATSGLPSVLKFFEQKGDNAHEEAMAKLEMERALAMAEKGLHLKKRLKSLKLTKLKWKHTQKKELLSTNMMKSMRKMPLLGLLISVLVFAPLSPIFLFLYFYLLT